MAGRGKLRNLPWRWVLPAARYHLAVRAVVALLFLAGAWLIFRGHFSNDIASMLPDGSRSAKSYTEINRSGMFHKVILSFSRKDGMEGSLADAVRLPDRRELPDAVG